MPSQLRSISLWRPTAAALMMLTAQAALGQSESVQWHGFLTAGSVFSNSLQPYDHGITQTASFSHDSKLGLNLSYNLGPHWAVAGQLLALGSDPTSNLNVDWAFATWYPFKGLAARFGKQKLSTWLISDHVEVGHNYPWVRPPQEVYSLNPINSVDGVDLSYMHSVGGGFDASLELISGTFDGILLNVTPTTTAHAHNLIEASAQVASDNVTLRASEIRAEVALSSQDYSVNHLVATFSSVGLKVDWHSFLLYAEWAKSLGEVDQNEINAANQAYGAAAAAAQQQPGIASQQALEVAAAQAGALNGSFVGGEAWYTTLGYQIDSFLPHITYATLLSPKNSIAAGDQESETVGVRYDISAAADLKLEAEHVHPRRATAGLYDPQTSAAAKPVSYKDLNVYSAVVDFVF